MLWSEKAGSNKVAGNPLPPKIAALLRESWWLALVAVALYLLLILATFQADDPSGIAHARRAGAVRPARIALVIRQQNEEEVERDRDQCEPPRFAQQGGNFRRQRIARYLCAPGFFTPQQSVSTSI